MEEVFRAAGSECFHRSLQEVEELLPEQLPVLRARWRSELIEAAFWLVDRFHCDICLDLFVG